jgi:hypothetical protein
VPARCLARCHLACHWHSSAPISTGQASYLGQTGLLGLQLHNGVEAKDPEPRTTPHWLGASAPMNKITRLLQGDHLYTSPSDLTRDLAFLSFCFPSGSPRLPLFCRSAWCLAMNIGFKVHGSHTSYFFCFLICIVRDFLKGGEKILPVTDK